MEAKKVVVMGGAGQAGRIHVKNLKSFGAHVACLDMVENPECDANFNPNDKKLADLVADGYTHLVIALPDTMLYKNCMDALDAQFQQILLEKPGATTCSELEMLDSLISQGPCASDIKMNYQRSFDPRVAQLLQSIEQKQEDGYFLDYVSVYSCDSAQPPQAAPQVLNQGCHDYNLFLSIIDAAHHTLADLQSRGVKWQGTKDDTKFFKITGQTFSWASEGEGERVYGLFDIQMGRVNSGGAFTELYVKMSKLNEEKNMYQPWEQKLRFPEQEDPNASWAEVWAEAFKESDRRFYEDDDGVHTRNGARVLRFAEMAKKSFEEGSKIIENEYAV